MIKITDFLLSKSIFYVKNCPNCSSFFSLKNINLGACFLLLPVLKNFNFSSTSFTKILLIFWSLDLERRLIWQKNCFMEKCYFSLNQPPIWCASCWKNLKCYLMYSNLETSIVFEKCASFLLNVPRQCSLVKMVKAWPVRLPCL